MTSGLLITALMPSITSSGIFSSRRANSGADAFAANNPLIGAMNLDIAGGQVLNAAKGVSNIAKESKGEIAKDIVSAEKSIKSMVKGGKVANGIGKVLSFTADNINGLICATSAVKVLCSDDKTDTAVREGLALGTMFASERAAKSFLGMSKTVKYNKDKMQITNDGLYEINKDGKKLIAKNGDFQVLDNKKVVISRKGNPFVEKQVEALKDYCATKKIFNKSLKFLPGFLKGVGFAAASIGGYKIGLSAADLIMGKDS